MKFKVGDRVEFIKDIAWAKKGTTDIVTKVGLSSGWIWLEKFSSCEPSWVKIKPYSKLEKAMK